LEAVTVQSVAASSSPCAVTTDGDVYCWGRNLSGELGDGTLTPRFGARKVPGLSGVTAVSTGSSSALALLDTGEVWGWGWNGDGALGQGEWSQDPVFVPVQVKQLNAASQISVGGDFACALVRGDAYCWGRNQYGQLGDGTRAPHYLPARVEGLPELVSVSSGGGQVCVLTKADDVYCWGENDDYSVENTADERVLHPFRVDVLRAAEEDLHDAGVP
jgi:alpha-tubulin suppressor-like RCC1 family protein